MTELTNDGVVHVDILNIRERKFCELDRHGRRNTRESSDRGRSGWPRRGRNAGRSGLDCLVLGKIGKSARERHHPTEVGHIRRDKKVLLIMANRSLLVF